METEAVKRPKVSDLPDNQLVEAYIKLRDRRAQRKAAFENDDAGDKDKQEKIEGIIMRRFQERGITSVGSASGTAYRQMRRTVSVASWGDFLPWVIENQAWDFLVKKATPSVVETFREENNDIPPGLNMREEYVINVKRS